MLRARKLPHLIESTSLTQAERRTMQTAIASLSEEVASLTRALKQSRDEAMQWRAKALGMAAPDQPSMQSARRPFQPPNPSARDDAFAVGR